VAQGTRDELVAAGGELEDAFFRAVAPAAEAAS
jgi:hypothetical protein